MSRVKKAVVEETPKHASMQVPTPLKAVLKDIQAALYKTKGFVPMGQIMAEAIAEKYPERAAELRKAGLID